VARTALGVHLLGADLARVVRASRDRAVKLAALQVALTTAAGAAGFRLLPDSLTYGSGALLPNSLCAGLVGLLGGMPLLVAVSAASAGACVALLPTSSARVRFMVCAGPWLLFPGADALGVLAVALLWRGRAQASARARLWILAAFAHLVAAVVTVPLLAGRFRPATGAALLALVVALVFTAADREGAIPWWEHLIYTSRYFLPAVWLWSASCLASATSERRPSARRSRVLAFARSAP
jgi:hypothetical protein